MKFALYGLVSAALLAMSGCATCCGPLGARPGSGCDAGFAEALWSDSCDTTCTGSTGPSCDGGCGGGCGSALDTLFGSGVCTAGCTTNADDSGYMGGEAAGGGYINGGYAGSGCNDPRCAGRCLGVGSAAGLAAQPVRQTVGRVGQAVAAMPHMMQSRCANGCCRPAMGPTQGSVQYPYYTTRGPRDFFLANPPGIGP